MMERFEHFSLAITEISRYWRKLATEEMEKYDLKGPHATYLTTIYRFPEGITVPQLCEISGKDKSDASRMIAILEKKGMVEKKTVDGSLYRGVLVLTEAGKEAAARVSNRAARVVALAGKDLDDEQRRAFYFALDTIVGNLRSLYRDGIPE
ncbi:MAG: winged helix-turn-helix transcriptional regulator [Clostridia bacterium]|nr:winged helix-turn-helix transcriptional regulator [Clostridia bacterium]MBR6753204.1 winged helix-turn-helix transcriptional regulator [Clostridia bacterium]